MKKAKHNGEGPQDKIGGNGWVFQRQKEVMYEIKGVKRYMIERY
jgi:hypothetical protein